MSNTMTGTCSRCHRHTGITIMSKFNTDEICVDCKELEQFHPDYDHASATELAQVQAGNYNYEGVGLPEGYVEWANKQREQADFDDSLTEDEPSN